jgi:hypothetical protein
MTDARYRHLNSVVLADKTADFCVGSIISGTKESAEADRLRFNHLARLHSEDEEAFVEQWVYFHLKDEDAQRNAWDLLSDYCEICRVGRLADLRTSGEWIRDSLSGESYSYPMGKVFAIQFLCRHTVASFLHLVPRPSVTIEVDVSQVVVAYGTLDDFRLVFDSYVLKCNQALTILLTGAEEMLKDCLSNWRASRQPWD